MRRGDNVVTDGDNKGSNNPTSRNNNNNMQ
jgi:hypothetical protein